MQPTVQQKFLSSFGRNRGRALRPHQQRLVEELLPKIAVNLAQPLAGHQGRVALEIGFGGGEHLLAQAAHHPDRLWLGCEPFLNGVAKCLAGIEQAGLRNVRILMEDARKLLEQLPPDSVDAAFILFPDPWPKARHNKRRLVNAQTLVMLARVQPSGGRLLLATDHLDYAQWMMEHILSCPYYQWAAEQQADWKTPPKDWTETKYQRKTSAQGRPPMFFELVRNDKKSLPFA
jgi:tRNA (guanine-N7-)-methyltransferase